MTKPLRIPASYEVRGFAGDLRVDADAGTFHGHASMFDNVDGHGTAFTRGAFAKTVADKGDRIPVLWFHEPTDVIGPTRVLREDAVGLYHESVAVDDGRSGTMVRAHLAAGNHLGMSFGFKTRRDRQATDADQIDLSTGPEGIRATDVRLITEVELAEISVLPWSFASNKKASVSMRQLLEEDALTQLLDDLRGGRRLDDTVTTLIADIAAAWTDRPERTASPPNGDRARHITTDDRRAALRFLAEATGIDPALMGLTEVLPA